MADLSQLVLPIKNQTTGAIQDQTFDLKTRPSIKKVLLLGDSYVQGIGGNGTTLESVIEGITNWDVRSFYSGGCGYLRVNSSNKKMLDVVNDAVSGTTDKDVITDVVLAASVYNDSGMSGQSSFNEASFISALEAINTVIKSNFPKARVTVIPSLWINVTYNGNYRRIFEWTKAGAQKIGANFAKNSLDWLTVYDSSVDSGDHAHPSALGYTIIGNHIASVINGTNPPLYNGVDIITVATGEQITITYHENFARIVGTITKESGQTFSSLFDVPQPLRKLSNYPVPYVKYGDNDAKMFLITGSTTYFPSDWLEVGSSYLINCDIPYNYFA